MATSEVWVSRLMQDSTLIKSFDSDYFSRDPENALDAMEKVREGIPLPADRFPKVFYADRTRKLLKKMPDIFLGGGYWIVSGELAEVLRQFDLGRTSFYPTDLFQYDRKRRIEGEYFCLNFGETKSVFVPEESRAKLVNPEQDWWFTRLDLRDDDIAVKQAATTGVDLWIDERVRYGVFFSGPLSRLCARPNSHGV